MACRICFSTDEVKLCGDCRIGYYCSNEHLALHSCLKKKQEEEDQEQEKDQEVIIKIQEAKVVSLDKKRPILRLEHLNEQQKKIPYLWQDL